MDKNEQTLFHCQKVGANGDFVVVRILVSLVVVRILVRYIVNNEFVCTKHMTYVVYVRTRHYFTHAVF